MGDDTLASITRRVEYGRLDLYITVVFNVDDSVNMFSAKIAKEGSTLGGLLASLTELANLVLKSGTSWSEIASLWTGKSFDPEYHPYKSLCDAMAINIDQMVSQYRTERSLDRMKDLIPDWISNWRDGDFTHTVYIMPEGYRLVTVKGGEVVEAIVCVDVYNDKVAFDEEVKRCQRLFE